MGNWKERKHSQVENRKLISEKIFSNDTRVLICSCEMKRSARKNHKLPAKRENHECFLLYQFPVITLYTV